MSALAKAAVALYPSVANGGLTAGQFRASDSELITRRLKLTLTGQGGQTNTIGAAALGFATLVSCSNLFDDQHNLGYPAAVNPPNNTIVLFDGSAAPAPVDVTSSAAYITVTGTAIIVPII